MANPVARVDSVGDSAYEKAPMSTVTTDDVVTEIRAEGVTWRGQGAAAAAAKDQADKDSRLADVAKGKDRWMALQREHWSRTKQEGDWFN